MMPLVSAQISDYQVSASEQEIQICSCQDYIDTINIRNNGQFHSSYTIESNLDYITSLTTSEIAPGESRNIQIPISIPCQEPIEKEYELIITNTYGDQQVLTRNLKINTCESIQAELSAEREVLPCQPHIYEITLTNPAPFTEEYTLKPVNYQEYFEEKGHVLTLLPGQTGIINNTLHLACDLYGNKTIKYEIISQKNDISQVLEHELKVQRAYDYAVEIQQKEVLCSEGDNLRVTLTNNADITNEYNLKLINNFWFASLEDKKIEIPPGESRETFINIRSGRETQRNITLIVESEFGDLVQEADIEINRKTCDDYDVQLIMQDAYCEGVHEVTVRVQNKGAQQNHPGIGFNNEIRNITVLPGTTEEYSFFIEEYPEGIEQIYFEANIADRWISHKTVDFYDEYHCRQAVIQQEIKTRYYDEEYLIELQNKGIEEETYSVIINGYNEIHTLSPGQKITLQIHQNFTSEDIGTKELYAEIIGLSNNIHYDKEIVLQIRDRPILQKIDSYLRDNPLVFIGIIYLFILLLLVLRIILGDKTSPGKAFVAIILIVLLLIVSITYTVIKLDTPTGIKEKNGSPLIIFYSDSNQTLDLDDYFIDPDEGILTYNVVDQPLIDYEITNSELKLIPRNFLGETNFTILAVDDQGDSVLSPYFHVETIEREPVTIETFNFLIIAVLIVILLILYVIPIKKEEL